MRRRRRQLGLQTRLGAQGAYSKTREKESMPMSSSSSGNLKGTSSSEQVRIQVQWQEVNLHGAGCKVQSETHRLASLATTLLF